jgi:hypothetical protein
MKFIKGDTSLRIQLSDTDRGKFTETPYEFISCVSNDGVNIIIESNIDPVSQDLIYAYVSVSEPVTANINILTEILSCWILEKSRVPKDVNGDRYIQHFPDVSSTGCWGVISHAACPNVLQAVGNTLYFDGLPLGGGGGITTVDNGLNESPAGNARLGGTLIQPTSIDQGPNSFIITSPIVTGGNTSFYSFPVLPDQGVIGISGTGGAFEVDGNSLNIRATVSSNINMITQDVANSTAINGQVLTLINAITGECEWQPATVPVGTLVSADNGLTENVPGNVRLGGTLVTNTIVNAATFNLSLANTSNTSQLNLNNGQTTLRASTNLFIATPNVVAGTSRANRVMNLINAATGQAEFSVLQNRTNMSTYYTQRWVNGGATVIARATGGIVSLDNSNITASTAGLPSTTITLTVGAFSYIGIGVNISGAGIPAGTFIVSQSTGTTGLTGDYVVNNISTVVAATPVAISGGVTGQINGTSVFSATSQNFVAATNDYLLGAGSPGGAFFTFNTITTPPTYDAVHTISATVITSADCVLTLLPLIDYHAFVVRTGGNALGQISNIAGIGYDQGTVCLAGVPTKVYCERFVKSNQNIGVTMYRNTNGINDNTSISFTTRDLTYTFNQI